MDKPVFESPLANHLLAALPGDEFKSVEKHLKPISLSIGETIYEAGEKSEYIYFPTSAIVSLLYTMEDGSTAEVGMAGDDGLIGIALYLGGTTTPSHAMVQRAGNTYRMSAKDLRSMFGLGGVFQNILLRYTQSLMTLVSQTTVCNRLHSVEQRFCRWLLINHDLVRSGNLIMTHERIANVLGVPRESISLVAADLQKRGLIRYTRGLIKSLDHRGMEKIVCECYMVVRDEYDRLLGKYISKHG